MLTTMRFSCWAVLALSACYAPTVLGGAPCEPGRDSCPTGQTCQATGSGNFCLGDGARGDAGADSPVPSTDGGGSCFGKGLLGSVCLTSAPTTTRAFTSTTTPEDLKKRDQPGTERESDVRVITRASYRFNGAGYLDPRHPQHIWTITAPGNADNKVTPRQLTSGHFAEADVTWANDGSQIYFTSDHSDEPAFDLPSTDIYSITVAGGQPLKLTTLDMNTGSLVVSPSGKQMAFTGSAGKPVTSYTQPDLWVMDIAPNAQPRNLTTGFDYDVGGGVGGDNAPPRGGGGGAPIWTSDGRGIIETYAREGKANLGMFDAASGKETDVTSGNQSVSNFRSAPRGPQLVFTISTPTRIGTILKTMVTPRLSSSNAAAAVHVVPAGLRNCSAMYVSAIPSAW
jgi:dipeptidyl aminopeptidase/acylaminoacyl peptidase